MLVTCILICYRITDFTKAVLVEIAEDHFKLCFFKMKHPCSQTHYNYSVQLNFLWVHSCQGLVFCVLLVTTHLRKIKAIISILHQNDEKYKLNKNKLNILCSLCKSQEICTYTWLVCLLVGLFRTSWMDLHKHFTRHWD